MEEDIFSPVSILKKTKVTEFVNINVKRERRGVIVEEEKEVGDDSDHDSEDSALCLKEEYNSNETSSSCSITILHHAPAPGNDHSNARLPESQI